MVLLFHSYVLISLVRFATASPSQAVLGGLVQEDPYATSTTNARENANEVFNAIHSALRQWGSSIRHNGVSFFPATVPEGTLLYHGGESSEEYESYEWLAFEIAHAEMFARGFPNAPKGASWRDAPLNERTLEARMGRDGDSVPGYLHIYRTNRPLKLLYFDGMSAAKCDKGPMELQDILVDHTAGLGYWRENVRAKALCAFGAEFGIEGFIRMETGFEIIKCDFKTGMDVVSVKKRPTSKSQPEGVHMWTLLEYIRDASKRYMGNMGGRVVLDYSSMVSAFFYPANLTNPDMGPKYPRLSSATPEQRLRIRTDLASILSNSHSSKSIDWQSVVDMIVARYSDRLQYLATNPPHPDFLGLVNNLLNLYIDYNQPTIEEQAIDTCAKHYLISVTPVTESDHLIYTSISTVTHEICSKLFAARSILLETERKHPTPPDDTERDFLLDDTPHGIILELSAYLDWTSWRFCPQTCALNEVCFTAMFPYGRKEDHDHPNCQNNTAVMEASIKTEQNYWWPRNLRPGEVA